ncbi:MAG TPA: hypothetical protein PKX00_19850, partial [Opitutaceae bacterium]|nr:hypothetical protein [Opitutaceae bacterium]
SLRSFSTLSPAGTRDRNVTPFPLRWAWAGPTSGLAQARHLSSIAMSLVVGKWAQLEGVAPSTPGDGPRTTAPDRFGIRDAQPAPTERCPPPQRKADYIHGTGFLPVLRLAWTFLVLAGLPGVVSAETTWRSAVTGQELRLESFEPIPPAPAGTRVPLALYLLHLAAPRNGTVPDATLIGELRAQGVRVVTVDFQGHAQARVPFLNRDLHGLRSAVQAGTLGGRQVDLARVYVVPSGHRLTRDLISAREAGRTLAFDLIAPAAPLRAPGVVLEFSCDNANRMGNASLQICSDTLLDAAAAEGWAVAMADHPVAAPYKGIDAMPSSALRAKAALRSVRKESVARGANGRIVPVGFSRGSGMALLLATTAGRSEFEGYGEAADVESSVQGAVVLSGRFTYLDLLPTDPMIPRYEKAWGTAAQQPDTWRRHGALDYATQALGVPLFLSINLAESPEALHQMSVLRRTLTAWNSPFVFQPESDGRGHKVPLDPAVLTALFRFLSDQLHPGAAPDGATSAAPAVARPSSL